MKRLIVDGLEVELDDSGLEIVRDGDEIRVKTDEGWKTARAVRVGGATLVSYRGRQYKVEPYRKSRSGGEKEGSGELRAPMPGLIVKVEATVGDVVSKGETILVLEAMKTQMPMKAGIAGRVARIEVAAGEQVKAEQLLAVLEIAADN